MLRYLLLGLLALTSCKRQGDKDAEERIRSLEAQVKEVSAQKSSPAATASSEASEVARIVGSAFITRRSGESTILRGLQVYLCDATFESIYHNHIKSHYPEGLAAPAAFEIDFLAVNYELPNWTKATTTTDINGKYEFRDIAPGQYCIFAKLTTNQSVATWVVSVRVDKGTTTLDLTNNNTANIVNQ
jgi:hypothetical protein